MALSNIGVTEGIDALVLVDDIGGTGYPISKMMLGTAGTNGGLVDENNPVPMISSSSSAFRDTVISQQTEQVSLNFTYEINPEILYDFTFGQATNISESGRLLISAGPTSNSIGAVVSRKTINYRPGMGACARFTAGFTTGISGVNAGASAGLGTEENAFLFNYKNNTMNILHRAHGQRDARLLTFTNGSNTSGNIVITLNDNLITGIVSDNTSLTANTANEFLSGLNPISLLIAGYQAFAYGNSIEFMALRTGPKNGSFGINFGASNANGTLTQLSTGVLATETLIPQSSWNHDVCDGTQFLPEIDWSKGNIFQIRYQWLGYGEVAFFVENPDNGNFIRVHDIHYAGTTNIPSVSNPNLPLIYSAGNGSTSDIVQIFGSSAAGFLEGGTVLVNNHNKKTVSSAKSIGTSPEILLAFYMPRIYKGKSTQTFAEGLRMIINSSAGGEIDIYKGTDIDPISLQGNVSWTQPTDNTLLVYNTTATGFSGGRLTAKYLTDGILDLASSQTESNLLEILPGELVVIQGLADQGTVKFGVTFIWAENK